MVGVAVSQKDSIQFCDIFSNGAETFFNPFKAASAVNQDFCFFIRDKDGVSVASGKQGAKF